MTNVKIHTGHENEERQRDLKPKRKKSPEQLLLQALANPLRVAILTELRKKGRSSASQHADASGESVSLTSYHFKALADAGLIEEVEKVQKRGTFEHIYKLAEGTPVFTILEMLEVAGPSSTVDVASKDFTLGRIELDTEASQRLTNLMDEARRNIQELVKDAAERLRKRGEKGTTFDIGFGVVPSTEEGDHHC